jgi:hypothetical protein
MNEKRQEMQSDGGGGLAARDTVCGQLREQ